MHNVQSLWNRDSRRETDFLRVLTICILGQELELLRSVR